jgi:hypothetical protein
MSNLRTVFATSWLLWGALLPIFGGLVLAARLDLDLWVGALAGGVVAVPLSLWGVRVADREAERQIRQEEAAAAAKPATAAASAGELGPWDMERVWPVLVALGVLALGAYGLVSGTAIIAWDRGGYTVSGVWGRVVAGGMVLFGAGWLWWGRQRERARGFWPGGLMIAGVILFVLGNLIAVIVHLVEGLVA